MFADDTSLIFKGKSDNQINTKIEPVMQWLNANRLSLNILKTSYIVFREKDQNYQPIEVFQKESVVKYLGLKLDNELKYQSHVNFVVQKLKKFFGLVSKLRHLCSKKVLLQYYNSHIKSVIQYGIIAYGNTHYNILVPILMIQKKIVRLMFFKKQHESTFDLFFDNKILTVNEIYIVCLTKCALECCSSLHKNQILNKLCVKTYLTASKTRMSSCRLFIQKLAKNKNDTFSLEYRIPVLLNFLHQHDMLPKNVYNLTLYQVKRYVDKLKSSFIQNQHLIDAVFGNQLAVKS